MRFSDGRSSRSGGLRRERQVRSAACGHRTKHRHRKRRFHIPPEALGRGFHGFEVELSSLLATSSPTPSSPPAEIVKPVTDIEPQSPSDQEVVQQVSRKGIKACAWILWCLLLLINLKLVFALLLSAVYAWPGRP